MKTAFQKIIILFSICFLVACQNNKSEFFTPIMTSEDGHFRGAQIGASIEQTKPLENQDFLIDEMEDYLHYDYEMSMGNSFTVTYDFSEKDQLYEIEVAIFLDVIEDADLLYKNLSDHFNRKYSVGKKEGDGYTSWNTTSSISNSKIAVSMINDSQSYGFITIFVRDLSY